MHVKKTVEIYTDGACSGNPGPGGWGALLRYNSHEKRISGFSSRTTNNRMELMAAIRAMENLKCPCQVIITTDSQYVRDGMTKWLPGWKTKGWVRARNKPVKNVDLWKRLDKLCRKHKVTWHWVRGHAGHPENEIADQLATYSIKEGLAGRINDDPAGML